MHDQDEDASQAGWNILTCVILTLLSYFVEPY